MILAPTPMCGRGPPGASSSTRADLRGSGPRLGAGGDAGALGGGPGGKSRALYGRKIPSWRAPDLPKIGGTLTVWPAAVSGRRSLWAGRPTRSGLRIDPTVLVDVPETDPVLEEEIFGPVLPILPYRSGRSWSQAAAEAPARWPSTCSPGTGGRRSGSWRPCPSGGGCVNDTVVHLADPRTPLRRVGNSGMGACHGKAGLTPYPLPKEVQARAALTSRPLRREAWAGKVSTCPASFEN